MMTLKTRWRAVAATATAALLLTVAACSSDGGSKDGGATGADGKTNLTVFMPQGTDQDLKTNKYTEYLSKKLDIGFTFQTTVYDGAAAKEARQISLASGQLPDVYMLVPWVDQFSPAEMLNLAAQGVLEPLNDLIDQYAPNIKAAFEENPEYKEMATSPDGNIYGLPQWNDCFHCTYQPKLWINKTWLKALDLEMPKTTDEMRTVLNAFLKNDPNGNGKADEIPISGSANSESVIGYFMDAFTYDPFAGETTSLPIALKDDKVVMQPIDDGWRQGLTYLSELWKDGVIDKAAFTQNTDAVQTKGNNEGDTILGTCAALHPAVCFALADDKPRHTEYDAVPPLTGPDGKSYTTLNWPSVPGAMFAVTSTASDAAKIAAIKMADDMYTFEGHALAQFGPKDADWREPKAGEVALDSSLEPTLARIPGDEKDEARKNGSWGSSGQLYSPAKWRNSEVAPEDVYLASGYERRLFEATKLYEPHAPKSNEAFPYWKIWIDPSVAGELATQQTNIVNHIKQSEVEFITGQKDITDDAQWAAYVKAFDGLGLQQYLQTYQTAYDKL